MKTPDYGGCVYVDDLGDGGETKLKDKKLEQRLANRDDVRDIVIVTTPPVKTFKGPKGARLMKQVVDKSETKFSWAMHWAIRVGDNYFELQRAHDDPTRTGLRMSKWDAEQQRQICEQYPQGFTALTDEEIKTAGNSQFSHLDRINFNNYSVWHHNCQVAVDNLLQEIGGLSHLRSNLKSLEQFARGFFCDAILALTTMYYRRRGCDEEVIEKHKTVLAKTLEIITARSLRYPKRQWIREDISKGHSIREKAGSLGDHWLLSILESSLSLRKRTEFSYIQRGPDGKPELKFDLMREAVKGIFDADEDSNKLPWLKALPWLVAGFVVGTPRWAVAVISLASQALMEPFQTEVDLKGGLKKSLIGVGVSPRSEDYQFPSAERKRPKRQGKRINSGRVKPKYLQSDNQLIERYERRVAVSGVPYFHDHKEKTNTWNTPSQQEVGLRIKNIPLSKRWEEKANEADGSRTFVHRITGEIRDDRPGMTETWVTKKRVSPDWVNSSIMSLPCGWQLCRTAEGEKYYVNHNRNPPTTHLIHPMRQEIEEERLLILQENWNVEWDEERGKKYRNLKTGEIRWKAIDGPQAGADKFKPVYGSERRHETFTEPLPRGWHLLTEESGQKFYFNQKQKIKRATHPNDDKRRILAREWEMRYNEYGLRYWVHYGGDGRGTTWWTRNKLVKNTSLKNNASGWRLAKKSNEWEWFEGGDVPHTDIPVLDLDDPAEFELREYPFILPKELVTPDGTFLEPLPPNWVRRHYENGNLSYFDFESKIWSDQHPYEKERQYLGAMWEMRFTRHGRQYFIDHTDGSTFWNNPHMRKNERKLRAHGGQKQTGWKLDDNGREWVAFEELPRSVQEEQAADDLALVQSVESASVDNDDEAETLSTQNFTRDWLKGISSDEMLFGVQKRIEQHGKDLTTETLLRSTQWIMAYGKQLREDERLANTLEWVKVHGTSENLETWIQQLKAGRENLQRRASDMLGLKENSNNEQESISVIPQVQERRSLHKRSPDKIGPKDSRSVRERSDSVSTLVDEQKTLYRRASDMLKVKDIKSKEEELRRASLQVISGWKSFNRKSSNIAWSTDREGENRIGKVVSLPAIHGNESSTPQVAATEGPTTGDIQEKDMEIISSTMESDQHAFQTRSPEKMGSEEDLAIGKPTENISLRPEDTQEEPIRNSFETFNIQGKELEEKKPKSLAERVKAGRESFMRQTSEFRLRRAKEAEEIQRANELKRDKESEGPG